MSSAQSRISLPGFGLSLGYNLNKYSWKFGHASILPYPKGVLVRERALCQAINLLTDKPEWRRKVFDEEITRKWRDEVVSEEDGVFSDRMFDFCLAELKDKAKQNTDNDIVRVLDDIFAVAKSDTIVPTDLHEALKTAVSRLLEDVPDELKDWHPGSDDKVLDLVHPSLFPLVYGRSKILTDRTTDLAHCLEDAGNGEVIEMNGSDTAAQWGLSNDATMSRRFQWLPTDFKFTPNSIKALSYINNLHPTHHQELYPLIERLIDAAVPMWSELLSFTRVDRCEIQRRFPDREACYDYEEGTGARVLHEKWEREGMPAQYRGEESDPQSIPDVYDIYPDNYPEEFGEEHELDHPYRTRRLVLPEPRGYGEYKEEVEKTVKLYPLEEEFANEGLQVIVKLANIHLEPEAPDYNGGSWHVEGMLNEKICATALYYYDSQNITDSYLEFRTDMDTEELVFGAPQNDFSGLETIFGIKDNEEAVQQVGKILTREGRMLAFPNCMQHCVAPFSLRDKTRPGHRKIVALFLVAPDRRIMSTSNIPPQRKDWWAEQTLLSLLGKVPPETACQIIDDVDHFPISMDDAKELRLELMSERGMRDDYEEGQRSEHTFFFCEH